MTMKSDAKFKEKLTFGFEYDMRNLVNFYPTILLLFNGIFSPKYARFELQKYRRVTFHDIE